METEVAVKISASDAASPKLRSVKASVDALESSTRRAQSSTQTWSGAYKQLQSSTDSLESSTRRVGGALVTVTTQTAQASRSWGGAYKQLQSSTQGFQSGLATTVNRGVTGMALLSTAAAGFGLKSAISLEQSNVSFKTFLGSAGAAKGFVGDLQSFAARTPFTLPGLTSSAKQMLAFGFAAKDVIPTLTAVGDAAAATGTGEQGIAQLTRALGQIKAKGRVQGDELLQIQEVGINVRPYLAKATGLKGAELEKAITGGKVSADVGVSAIVKGLQGEKLFTGMMGELNKTLGGQLSNLQDAFTTGLGNALLPVLPQITASLPAVGTQLSKTLTQIAPKLPPLVDAFTTLAPIAVDVAGSFTGLAVSAAPAIKTVADFLGPDGIKGTLVGLVALRGAFAVASGAQAVGGVVSSFQTVMDTAGKLNDSFDTVSGMATKAASAMRLISGASAVAPAAAGAAGAGAAAGGAGAAAGAGAVGTAAAGLGLVGVGAVAGGVVAAAGTGYGIYRMQTDNSLKNNPAFQQGLLTSTGRWSNRGLSEPLGKYQPLQSLSPVQQLFAPDSARLGGPQDRLIGARSRGPGSPPTVTSSRAVVPVVPSSQILGAARPQRDVVPVRPFTPGAPPSVKRGVDVAPYAPGPRQQPQRDVVSVAPPAAAREPAGSFTINTGGVTVNNPTSNVDVTKAVQDAHDQALREFARQRQARG